MSEMIPIYRAHFKRSFALEMQYRASLVIWALSALVEPILYVAVWRTVAIAQGGQVGDYDVSDFAAYFLAVLLVSHLTFSWIMWEYEFRIREGLLSQALLRPIHPIHSDIADNLAYKLVALVVLIPAMLAMTLLFRPVFHPQPWALVAFLPTLVLAFVLRFLFEWALALSAFWTTRIGAINQVYFFVLMFMSGRISPLSLLPPPIETLASFLPFRWMLAFPVELVLGRLTPTDLWLGLAAQLGWIGVALGVLTLVWRVGVRQYTGVGS